MSDIGPISSASPTPEINSHAAETAVRNKHADVAHVAEPAMDIKADEKAVVKAVVEVETLVNAVSETSLSFSVDKELSRMVVAVRAVGSDEIIRQFPPEEFMTVAKFIAAQNPDSLDEDFLKGILYDQFT